MMRIALCFPVLLAAALSLSAPARADEGAALSLATKLFVEGKRLMKAEAYAQALERFRASRDIKPGRGNTQNAAHCLGMLEQWDEALEMYEELSGKFGAELAPEELDSVKKVMKTYRERIGSLDLSANVNGDVQIDGRSRGQLPLGAPLHVLPGKHLVRVQKEGYAPFETIVVITVKQNTSVDGRLTPLANVGRLRVRADKGAELSSAKLWIDGSLVAGSLPWEGNLAPGPHVLSAVSGDVGSALVRVFVVEAQSTTIDLKALPLGATTTLLTDPSDATISIDGVDLGRGGFVGRLPLGDHEVVVREDAYHSATLTLHSTRDKVERYRVTLPADWTHPRWRSGARLRFEVLASPVVSSSFRSDAEKLSGGDLAFGGAFTARIGVELPIRLAFDLSGIYLLATRRVSRSLWRSFRADGQTSGVRYDVREDLHLQGQLAALGVRQRLPFGGDRFDLRFGLGFAFGSLSAQDVSKITATSAGETASAATDQNGVPVASWALMLLPELDARYRVGGIELGLGLGAMVSLVEGSSLITGETVVSGCPRTTPSSVRCAPGAMLFEDERGFGRFVAWAPRFMLGGAF